MIVTKEFLTALSVFFALSVCSSCTTTVTKAKAPVFNTGTKVIQEDILRLTKCEHINVSGKEITTEGKSKSTVEISILNGQSLPTDNNEIKALGKSIAEEIKKSLKDPNEYEEYKVLFVTKKTDGSVTKSFSQGFDFRSQEL